MHFRILQNKPYIVPHGSIETVFYHILSPKIRRSLPSNEALHFTPLCSMHIIRIINDFELFGFPFAFVDTGIIEVDPSITNLHLISAKTFFSELLGDFFPFLRGIFWV